MSGQGLGGGGPVRVFVPGRARTKGSMKPDQKRTGAGRMVVVLRESGEYSVAWKNKMVRTIKREAVCERYEGAVWVELIFAFEPEHQTDRDGIADGSRPWPITAGYGDLDKLERNVLDALTQSGLIRDDSQVVQIASSKCWADPGTLPGAWITVEPAR